MSRTPYFWPRFALAVVMMLTVVPIMAVVRSGWKWIPYFVLGFFGDIGYFYMTNVLHLQQAVREHRAEK